MWMGNKPAYELELSMIGISFADGLMPPTVC